MMHKVLLAITAAIGTIAATAILVLSGPAAVSALGGGSSSVFVNEIHYDNTGGDLGEFIEIAGPAGTDLSTWSLVLYNGSNGTAYDTTPLSGTIDDEGSGFGALEFLISGIQNGGPDGVALVDDGTLVQFLSYEGAFTGSGGVADGVTSTDIGVAETSSTPVGASLHLTGTGSTANDFTWAVTTDDSPGSLNAGQTLMPVAPPTPVINEFSYSTAGTDVEFVELFGEPSTDYSSYTILVLESDDSNLGDVNEAIAMGTTDAAGIFVVNLAANTLANEPTSFLLVEGFTGAAGDDLDSDDDGTLDSMPWSALVDDVAAGTIESPHAYYSSVVLDDTFDFALVGSTFAPGGASRLPDGADTDTTSDWLRNDFDLAGITGFSGSPDPGEALNTPGAPNAAVPTGLVINEIMNNPDAVSDGSGEWFELYNPGPVAVDIDGWEISDNGTNSHTIANGGPLEVPAGGYLVLGVNDDSGTNGGVTVDYEFPSSFALGNSDDEVILTDDNADEVDRVEWDGGPGFPDPTGASMALTDPTLDNNVGANWCTSSVAQLIGGDFGTPGTANDCVPVVGFTLISAIQGSVPAPDPDTPTPFPAAGDTADDSPLLGQTVTIEGIVTGWDDLAGQSNSGAIFHNDRGFFVQEEDADADADPTTSEGIFVQFSSATDDVADYQPGDKVQVTGQVEEHFEFTVIGDGATITEIDSGNPLPSAVTINPATIDRDGWEAVEGQRVLVEDAVANSGGTNRFNELVLTPGTTQDILIRPETNAGIFALQADAGAGNPAIPRKPDAPSATVVKADLFDTVEDATGPVAYSFDLYKIMVQPGALPTVVDTGISFPFTGVAPATAGQIRVTALNVENFFPVGIVHDGAATTTQEFNNKRDRIADAVDKLLERPDIVGVEEVYDLASLQAVASTLGGYTAHLIEGNDNRGIDVGFLTKDSTVTVNSVTQFGKLEPDPTPDGCGDIAGLLFDRPPLAVDVTVQGVNMVVFNNHFSSKAAPDSCREAQATFLRDTVNTLETAGKNVIVTGDINAFEDESALAILEDGTTTLDNLWDDVPLDEAYSFQFAGVLQTLDHMLITDGLAALSPEIDYAHFDTAYYSRQLDEASLLTPFTDGHKVSDHDPPVLTLTAPAEIVILDDPCVVYDSTTATDMNLDGSLAPGESRTVQVTGTLVGQGGESDCAVPAGASAAIVALTAKDPQAVGNLRISAAGVAPTGGVVNYVANGLDNSNTVTVSLSTDGAIDIAANAGATDVRAAVIAYYSPTASGPGYFPLTPCAVMDSRSSQGSAGGFVGPFAAGAAIPDVDVVGTFNLAGDNQGGGNTDCGVPSTATAVMVNVVAIQGAGGEGGFAVGVGGTEPSEPTTNFAPIGLNNAASLVVPLDGGETLAANLIAATGVPMSHLRIVVLGYFDTGGAEYTAANPCAIFDSRPGRGASGAFLGKRVSGAATTYDIVGTPGAAQGGEVAGCGVPSSADAVLINLVSIQPDEVGNFRAYATGSSPTGGVLNFASLSPAANNSNAIVVPLSGLGQLDLFVNTATNDGSPATHVRGVVLGWYE